MRTSMQQHQVQNPFQPMPVEHVRPFDYSKLSRHEVFMLHSAAIMSRHLTKAQRERLINLNLPYSEN